LLLVHTTFVDGTKPFRPGLFVVKNGEHHGGRSIQLHLVFEAHRRGVEERECQGAAGEVHGSASKGCWGIGRGGGVQGSPPAWHQAAAEWAAIDPAGATQLDEL
jgi:hypothetical protein